MGFHYRDYGNTHLKLRAYFTTNPISKIKTVAFDLHPRNAPCHQSYLFNNSVSLKMFRFPWRRV